MPPHQSSSRQHNNNNSSNSNPYLLCVTTKTPPPSNSLHTTSSTTTTTNTNSSNSNDVLQTICPYTGSILTSTTNSSGLSLGSSIGIHSFAPLNLLGSGGSTNNGGGGNDDSSSSSCYIAYGGRSPKDMHCHFLTTSNSSSSGSSSNKQNTKWNCRLPEFLTAGLTPSPCGRYILGGGTSGTCYCWSTFGSSSGSGGE